MMKLLTTWRTCWHHVFLTLWRIFDVTNYWRHDVCCTYWRNNDNCDARNVFTTFCWHPLLTHFLTSWLTCSLHYCRSDCIVSLFREQNIIKKNKTCFWCHNEICWCHGMFLMSWRHRVFFYFMTKRFDIMTNFSNFWRIFDVMTCCWCHHMFLTSWQTLWRHGESFDVMNC